MLIKGLKHQESRTIINIEASNNRGPNIWSKHYNRNRQYSNYSWRFPVPSFSNKTRNKINKDTEDLNNYQPTVPN